MFRILVTVLLVGGLIAMGGCRRASKKLSEKMMERGIEKSGGGKADVTVTDGKVSVKTKEGEFEAATGAEAKVPDGFPKDVFLPKGGKVVSTVKVPQGIMVAMELEDSPDKVAAEVAAAMKTEGWTEAMSSASGDTRMFNYAKEESKRSANFVISKSDKGCQIQIMAAVEK